TQSAAQTTPHPATPATPAAACLPIVLSLASATSQNHSDRADHSCRDRSAADRPRTASAPPKLAPFPRPASAAPPGACSASRDSPALLDSAPEAATNPASRW